jgi:alpha-beta hydrolase superfamily lysophospholipase
MSAISFLSARKILLRKHIAKIGALFVFAILFISSNCLFAEDKKLDQNDPFATDELFAPEKESADKDLEPKKDAVKEKEKEKDKDKEKKADPDAKTADDTKKNAKAGKEKEKIPDPEEQTLVTSDGVRLALTYFPSNRGREAIPVVLLHMFKGTRADYKTLALALQEKGYAVVVPDLRGHGGSTKQKVAGTEYVLNAAKMPVDQYKLMIDKDMYAVKEFLWEKNNAKELNLNKLCVVGAEMGASVAMNFAVFDSLGYGDSDRGPYYGTLQLGQFVKSIVLLSPEVSFKGLPLAPMQNELRKNIPVLIIVGKQDAKSHDEAERVSKIFKRIPPKLDEDRTYFFKPLDTKLQGTKLLDSKSLEVTDKLLFPFLQLRLKDADEVKDWGWKPLKKPHENG